MSANYKPRLKTVGPRMAQLLTALHDRSQTTFTLRDVEKITGLQPNLASSLLHKAANRGLVSRLKRGVFVIVPAELGSATEYSGNPYLVARQLAGEAPYFISHASAMELHRMVTQPQLVVFASSTRRIPSRTLQGTEFRFVLVKRAQFFGTTKHWVTKQEFVDVSDLERRDDHPSAVVHPRLQPRPEPLSLWRRLQADPGGPRAHDHGRAREHPRHPERRIR